jgi:hypothetical protein
MSNLLATPARRSVAVLLGLYGLAYLAGCWLDLTTTTMALRHPGASEGNIYATDAAGYVAARAWTINLAAFLLVGACLVWSARNAGKVAEVWLERPVRSFAKFYINPFAPGVADRSALHMLSFVLAFPLLRLLAAGNNLMIWRTGTGPLGWLIGVLSKAGSPALAFWLVMAPVFYLAAFAVSPFAARILRGLRQDPGLHPAGGAILHG